MLEIHFVYDVVFALNSLKYVLDNTPPNWIGSDPCGSGWEGVRCTNFRVTTITLTSMGLTGMLPGDIESLSELQTLKNLTISFYLRDLSYNKGLTGPIPASIGNLKKLTNLILIGSGFSGPIPGTIGSLQQLVMLSLNSNGFSGPIPPQLGNLSNLYWLDLADNKLSGAIPVSDATTPGLDMLTNAKHLLFENNSLSGSIPSTLGLVQTLEVLRLDRNSLTGPVPSNLNSLVNVNELFLSNNQLTGSLPNLTGMSVLNYMDMSNNTFDESDFPTWFSTLQSLTTLVMESTGLQGQIPVSFFTLPQLQTLVLRNNQLNGTLDVGSSYSDQLKLIDLQNNFIVDFTQRPGFKIKLILAGNPFCQETEGTSPYCGLQETNSTYSSLENHCIPATCIAHQLSSPNCRCAHAYVGTHKSSSTAIIIGSAVGGSVLVLLALLAGIYVFRQKRKAETADKQNNPFASWDPNKNSGDVPQLRGARSFSFAELKKYTNNFSETNDIGTGGYGKVYRGILPNGQLVAVKRAQSRSMQGGHEFKTEIELLSRVHHKNVVSLVGFCFEQGEQMLVYEYIPNGTLKESLSGTLGLFGKSGIKLDWMRRLRIALGTARGLQYLHELANPPIIHRDIKSNNILLDDRLNAKVADFGLSKLLGDPEKGHVTTQVKGTMGYMDPEYYMTQQLTEKSDVYSYGVVMLELVTARQPIDKGKYIVREVRQKMDRTKVGYNLQEIIDPAILGITLGGLEKFVDLALRCVEEAGVERPTMGEVVKEIESIMQIAGLNPNADSASTSASYEGANKGYDHPYTDESLFVYSGAFLPAKVEPQ
ncbi:hypothetical protein RHGRI_015036 [Rhododendron griersonianum]|uniref:non-specific serine/threonine protein kinase n=1 Tax=Rhododendron griersonianum TaxID=479676 RepID=A0AAV6KC87_9ERIC|nr:hypothetical protein RHGRI_015036 [Rhododendron griersonianum]